MDEGRFELSIEMGNDAMQTSDDVADALEQVVKRMRGGDVRGSIRDLNGNTIGEFGFLETA